MCIVCLLDEAMTGRVCKCEAERLRVAACLGPNDDLMDYGHRRRRRSQLDSITVRMLLWVLINDELRENVTFQEWDQ